MLFSAVSYEENRRFLASVAKAPSSTLHGFRQHGSGVELTFVVSSDLGLDFALQVATQRATGLWPNFRPASTTVHVMSGSH